MTRMTHSVSAEAGRGRDGAGTPILQRRPLSVDRRFGIAQEAESSSGVFAGSRFAHDFTRVLQRQAIDESDNEPVSAEENADSIEKVAIGDEGADVAAAAPGGSVMEWRDIDVAGAAIDMGADAGAGVTQLQSDAGAGPSERSSDAGTQSEAGTEGRTDGGTAQPDGGGGSSGSTASCDPQPLTRANFLQQPGVRPRDLGLTRLAGQVGVPVVQVNNGRVQSTAAQLAPLTSVYTQGIFVEGTGSWFNQGGGRECPSGTYPKQWTIAGTGEAKIIEGEREHCTDLRLAFDMSLVRFAQAVNMAAQSGRRFANQQAAERFFQRQVGVAPANWFAHFECLATKTKSRDNSNAHEPVGLDRGSIPPMHPCDQAKIRVILREMHFPRIPGPSSSSLITPAGCPV